MKTIDRIREMFDQGMRQADIARALGVTRGAVHYAIRRRGLGETPAAERIAARRAAVRELAAQGLRRREIAQRLGVVPGTVAADARNLGIAFSPVPLGHWADPVLAALTPEERQDYDLLRHQGRQSRNDALRAVGRADLVRE